ncbi:MAG: lipopolysaccharide biosynthesis protein, partial [Elusimicrobiales bacterium]|nr:lipopolysaccharide biosynthesis protein [Elusimicrobiales bacterium]
MRMLLLLTISLFTSRVVFRELGASDFGLYNVVAGFVMMLTFLNGAMSNATQRFLSFELVKKDAIALRDVFCQIQILHAGIAIIVLILGETIGLWFVNNVLNIGEDRLFAANIVYQCSLLSTVLSIISVPYNSVIIAHENMKLFAQIGLLEGCLKLAICFFLFISSFDKLIIYGISLAIISIIIQLLYFKVCRKYEETFFYFSINKKKLKEIGLFALWSLCGSISTLANMQGINILIN